MADEGEVHEEAERLTQPDWLKTSTATVPATATARVQPTDDGCAVVAPDQTGTPWWVLFIPTLLIMRRRGMR